MSGIYASPEVRNGKTVWYIKSTDSKKVLAKGRTISDAMNKLEEQQYGKNGADLPPFSTVQ